MSLAERTLVIRDLKPTNKDVLEQLFSQFGPVLSVCLRRNFAMIEYPDKESVAYAWAMAEGICLYGQTIRVEPKVRSDLSYRTYCDRLQKFEDDLKDKPSFINRFLNDEQLKEKKKIIKSLNSSKIAQMRQRVQNYKLKSFYNPILNIKFHESHFERNAYDYKSYDNRERPSKHHHFNSWSSSSRNNERRKSSYYSHDRDHDRQKQNETNKRKHY